MIEGTNGLRSSAAALGACAISNEAIEERRKACHEEKCHGDQRDD